jgi:transcriptional regulator with XRE-family HTH domain
MEAIPAHLLFTQPTPESVSLRLRQLRKERGWSLHEVEKISKGRIKAVVLGSYERADRALSLKRAIELANFYSIPLSHLLNSVTADNLSDGTRVVIDLRRVSAIAQRSDSKTLALVDFVRWIADQRSDWNGEVMSVRDSDIAVLALMARTDQSQISEWLTNEKLILSAIS